MIHARRQIRNCFRHKTLHLDCMVYHVTNDTKTAFERRGHMVDGAY